MLVPANLTYPQPIWGDISDGGPGEDAPRLVFADWLQEHGHPWGELIAVQCGLVHAAAATPERARLLRREHELLSDRSWWPYDGSGFQVETFVRGFPGRIRAQSAAGLKSLLTRMPWMPDAECIELTLAEGDMLGLAALGRLPAKGFALVSGDNYFFDVLDAKLFVRWLELHALRLRRFAYHGQAAADALATVFATPLAFRALEEASFGHLAGAGARWINAAAFADFARAPALRRLAFASVRAPVDLALPRRLEAFAETGLAWDSGLPPGPRTTGRPDTLASLRATVQSLPRLKHLDLSERGLNDAAALALLESAELETVALAKNPITARTAESFVDAPRLQALELWGTNLGDAGAALVARTRCESLELVNIGMTAKGARALAGSTTLPPTLRLTVSRAEVGDGLPALRERYAVVVAH